MLTFWTVKVSWWRVFALLMIYSFNMALNHIAVINQQGSYQDISGPILFTPGMEISIHLQNLLSCGADLGPKLLRQLFLGPEKGPWNRFHAAFEICCVLQRLRGQHTLYPCINTDCTHPMNAARWAPKTTEASSAVIVMCHGRPQAAVIGFSSRGAAQTPPLPRLFTLSTVQIAAAPAHISLRYG